VGKSQLAKALVAALGEDICARVPGDWFIVPAAEPLATYFARPLRYDWAPLDRVVSTPVGALVALPAFDFVTFRRVSDDGGAPLVVRPVLVVDAMYPCPRADFTVLLRVGDEIRRARIVERDQRWGSSVVDRWEHLQASKAWLERQGVAYDLTLTGPVPLDEHARRVAEAFHRRFGG